MGFGGGRPLGVTGVCPPATYLFVSPDTERNTMALGLEPPLLKQAIRCLVLILCSSRPDRPVRWLVVPFLVPAVTLRHPAGIPAPLVVRVSGRRFTTGKIRQLRLIVLLTKTGVAGDTTPTRTNPKGTPMLAPLLRQIGDKAWNMQTYAALASTDQTQRTKAWSYMLRARKVLMRALKRV